MRGNATPAMGVSQPRDGVPCKCDDFDSMQAADYSAATQYLNAVKATGTDNPEKIMDYLKKAKFNDMYVKNGYVRADGTMVHDMYLMQVKQQAESKYPWDYYTVVQTVPGEQAFTTKEETKCALWK